MLVSGRSLGVHKGKVGALGEKGIVVLLLSP
jgi:hypothetical protein